MGRYNLLDEPWIEVIRENGHTEKVSLKEVFARAQDYYDLAGEMKTQDFAVLRVLVAVLQTVFSRFDSDGNPYDFMNLDKETFQPLELVDLEELEDEDPLYDTWQNLWKMGRFPDIVQEYLEAWRDHFFLYDETYPFYQVTAEDMDQLAAGGGEFFGKNINRTISESGNKTALFSPIAEGAKDILRNDQLARWLIMLQGYIGTGDKKKVRETKSSWSKGWLYDLGGVYLKGHTLFETLMLNSILSTDFDKDLDDETLRPQIPCWERSPIENVDIYFDRKVDNRTSLLTNWSRAVAIDPGHQESEKFSCFIAKLPEIDHVDNFMEPMTCWTQNKTEFNENYFTPKKHRPDEAVWRHFNVLMGVGEENGVHFRQPGILSWYHKICERRSMSDLKHYKITLCIVSMKEDGNQASWLPIDEIIDQIQMETAVLVDNNQDGWIDQISTLINSSKTRVEQTLVKFLRQVSTIRGLKDLHLIQQGREKLYREIDGSFRDWLYDLQETDSMNDKALEWYSILERAIRRNGEEILREASPRDLKGIPKDTKVLNISMAYNYFEHDVFVQFHTT